MTLTLCRYCAAMILLAVAMTLGCAKSSAKKVVTIEGTATYNGQILTSGLLTLVAPNGDLAVASILPDGKFIMTDVAPGTHQVGYTTAPVNSGGPMSAPAGNKAPPKPPAVVPPKFADAKKSGVTVTVDESGKPVVIEFR